MKLEWTLIARTDRVRIAHTIAQDSPSAARKLDIRLETSADALLDYPYRGRSGRLEMTRELVVHPSYILVYEVDGDTIRVLTVIHAAQRWP
ncbi:type II toxin-antitoxin system RelE/ParE family toxin [Pelagibacterium sp. H642]|uniref:type II toxin-antitoxin system RelE/ParE family toxin n=1 Tax=Pelagibacterium sp. H642 TaxID=1881069 RepID=UPI002814BDA0|nr:type II toxin-antitoxin system RelE/ParE family toxin [Pelagibacterium sp. H642]WMT90908.1 type II toxin-antitoxin system RelE/ParE family toxin [Pelagibacterium sp. H642]